MTPKSSRILIHIIAGIFFLSLPVLFSPDLNADLDFLYFKGFWRDFTIYCILLVFFYCSYYFLFPYLFFKRKYLLFAIGIVFFFALLVFIPDLIIYGSLEHGPPIPRGVPSNISRLHRGNWFIMEMRRHFFEFAIVLVFTLLLKVYERWKKAESEKLNAELSYLKAQVNPHFLFNTLNSIYSLALEKSDNTAPAIVKLAGLMRYVITESGKDFVSLEKEVNYIQDYFDLQKIRLDGTIETQLDIKGFAGDKKIAPLLLIPFVENAFKYGVNPEENSLIRINIDISESQLKLLVSNNKVRTTLPKDAAGGLGIKNTRERLDLLYPGKYKLDIRENDTGFSVTLLIDLV